MRIALAQINPTVGDFAGNLALIREAAGGVAAGGSGAVDLIVFPELCVSSYMPRDLLGEPSFLDSCEAVLDDLAAWAGPPLLVGCPLRAEGPGKPLINAAVLLRDGRRTVIAKRYLPTYDVFDEHRYFRSGGPSQPVEIAGSKVGITVCEDIWKGPLYDGNPVQDLCDLGAEYIVNLSASPYERGKPGFRRELVGSYGVPMALINLVGANDQLIFDGNSFALDGKGNLCAHAAAFSPDVVVTDFTGTAQPPKERLADAIVLGIADYFAKTGFSEALIGMSGGVDSSLTACLAVEALGKDHVVGVAMPGPYSADYSLDDAETLARSLGIRFETVPITSAYERLRKDLGAVWGKRSPFGVAEENLQARLRGTVLMSLANKWNALVLVPSNKSELAMGYCTLYGDMVGALAPLSDVYKTEIYELARAYPMPPRVFERPPSAELAPDQTDQDSLPPYEVLDPILRLHLEERRPAAEIAARGYDAETVARILRTVSIHEYKRQQGAPMLKVSSKAFDLDRRFPIVERYRGGTSRDSGR